MPAEDADHNAAIERINKELKALFAAQSKALHDAVYVGMSHDEVKEFDERLEQIKKLVSELTNLGKRRAAPRVDRIRLGLFPFEIRSIVVINSA